MNTTTPQALSESLKRRARELGFDACGISTARFLEEEAPRLEHYLRQGYHGQMHYMEGHFDKRLDPRLLVDGAQSVVSVLLSYKPAHEQRHPDAPRLAKYAYGRDYHLVIKEKLALLLQHLTQLVGPVQGRAFVDSAPVLDRAWARQAGLGWVGKNGNLIHRKLGSLLFVGQLIIDTPLAPDLEVATDHCGSCTRCIDACPTQAIVAPRQVDGSKCISYFTIELRDALPEHLGQRMQNWMFGCDICQDVCPWNRKAPIHHEAQFAPREGLLEMTRAEWMDLTEEVFDSLFRQSAVKRTKYLGLRRNLDFLQRYASE